VTHPQREPRQSTGGGAAGSALSNRVPCIWRSSSGTRDSPLQKSHIRLVDVLAMIPIILWVNRNELVGRAARCRPILPAQAAVHAGKQWSSGAISNSCLERTQIDADCWWAYYCCTGTYIDALFAFQSASDGGDNPRIDAASTANAIVRPAATFVCVPKSYNLAGSEQVHQTNVWRRSSESTDICVRILDIAVFIWSNDLQDRPVLGRVRRPIDTRCEEAASARNRLATCLHDG